MFVILSVFDVVTRYFFDNFRTLFKKIFEQKHFKKSYLCRKNISQAKLENQARPENQAKPLSQAKLLKFQTWPSQAQSKPSKLVGFGQVWLSGSKDKHHIMWFTYSNILTPIIKLFLLWRLVFCQDLWFLSGRSVYVHTFEDECRK
jgi:hypothetical protein